MIALTLIDPPCELCTALCCKCRGRAYVVELKPEEVDRFPEAVFTDNTWVIPLVDGKCVFLGTNDRCTIYERRPFLCVEYNCLNGYKSKENGSHSFFLDDHPELVDIIERSLI